MTTIYITKQFVAGTLKGLTYTSPMPGFRDEAAARAWVEAHRTTPVKSGSAPYIVIDASFCGKLDAYRETV
jgi:hypothetical protein